MKLAQSIRMFASKAAWDITGSRGAGQNLIRGVHSDDETVRTIAGIMIVRKGEKAEPLLLEELETGRDVSFILTLLADVGTQAAEAEVERYLDDPDPAIARAAREALEAIETRSPGRRDPAAGPRR